MEEKSAYGKRPLWQWIALYVVIAVVVYGVIYIAFIHKQSPNTMQVNSTQPTQAAQITQSTQQAQNSVYKMVQTGSIGTIMTDVKGMTLYTYAKDTAGVSNCTGQCLANWPAYTAPAQTGNFPANVSVIKRSDGTLQYAWKGMPLYYFVKDSVQGDAKGNGVGGVWSVIQ